MYPQHSFEDGPKNDPPSPGRLYLDGALISKRRRDQNHSKTYVEIATIKL